jgi:hypothetical protein
MQNKEPAMTETVQMGQAVLCLCMVIAGNIEERLKSDKFS